MRGAARGMTMVELLVGVTLGLVVAGAMLGGIGVGLRAARAVGLRGESEDLAQGAVETFAFDVRRLAFDPQASGRPTLTQAALDRLGIEADLDANGTIDPASEEVVSYVYNRSLARLSRVVGAQSLPLADGVVGCAFSYFNAAGQALVVPASGLTSTDRRRVRAIGLDLRIAPHARVQPVARRMVVALRTLP